MNYSNVSGSLHIRNIVPSLSFAQMKGCVVHDSETGASVWVNGVNVESFQRRNGATEITFVSGRVLKAYEDCEKIAALMLDC